MHFDTVGKICVSLAGAFKAVPDAFVGSFELTLLQGKFLALVANGNLCSAIRP
jgi:hypothetical protein